MNAQKHMELIFGAGLALACVVAVAPDDMGRHDQPQAARAAIPVVVIKGKRMTELEKRQSLELDAGARSAAGSWTAAAGQPRCYCA